MQLSISINNLKHYISKQLNNFFPDNDIVKPSDFDRYIEFAIEKIEYCFARVKFARYRENNQTIFNHLYSDHYVVFIWFLSNSIWKNTSNKVLASKLYYLNKALHGFDCLYDTELPDIFLVFHGMGTMLGKAKYSDFFIAMQGCTVGTNDNIHYPVFGKGVALTAHTSVIGKCNIGEIVTISANTSIFKRDIPKKSLVYRNSENGMLIIKESDYHFIHKIYDMDYFNV